MVLFHGATKNYMTDHNTMRTGHLHDDRKSYGSKPEAIFPFPGEAAGHTNGHMLHRKFMWQDRHSATQRSPTVQAVSSKQAENLLVGKTKSYSTNNKGLYCVLSVVDNRCYKRILYEVLDHDPTHDDITAFFERLKTALATRDLRLQGITTDGSP